MPLPAQIIITIVSLGAIGLFVYQIRDLRRRKRNLKHFERNEPLEGVDDWD